MKVKTIFEERNEEIESYISLLKGIEASIRSGVPKLSGAEEVKVSAKQQKILYSACYLMLYNLVESTINGCFEALTKTAVEGKSYYPHDLSDSYRRAWVGFIAKTTNLNMSPKARLDAAMELCRYFLESRPVYPFKYDLSSGGNWDDENIMSTVGEFGIVINLEREVEARVKMPFRDEKSALKFIKDQRNKLAHGEISFSQCNENDDSSTMSELHMTIKSYLSCVIRDFQDHVEGYHFLDPKRRSV